MRRVVERPKWVTPLKDLRGMWSDVHVHLAGKAPEALDLEPWGAGWVIDHLAYVERPWFSFWTSGPFSRELVSVGVRFKL
jgi:hypothetical protein